MRILVVMENVADKKAFSGGRYHAWLVARALVSLGHKVTVLTGRVPVWMKELPGKAPDVRVVRPYLTAKSCRLRSKDKFDLVCVFPLKAIPWGVKLAKELGAPAFSWIFDPFLMITQYAGDIAQRMGYNVTQRRALSESTRLITSTAFSVPFVRSWIGANVNVDVLHPCVNSRVADRVVPQHTSTFDVVAITRLTGHKRPDDVFRAFAALARDRQLKARLLILSGFEAGGLTRLAKKHHVAGSTVFRAKCSETEKWQLLKGASLVIAGSTYEGFGLWLAEAIYAAVPFVVHDFPIFREIAYGGGGWFAEFANSRDFVRCVHEAAHSDLRGQRMHLTSIAERYGFEAFKERVRGLIAHV